MESLSHILPVEIVNNILSFRPVHPTAELIHILINKTYLCINCFEEPRYRDNKFCSSSCDISFHDGWYLDHCKYDGEQFINLIRRNILL